MIQDYICLILINYMSTTYVNTGATYCVFYMPVPGWWADQILHKHEGVELGQAQGKLEFEWCLIKKKVWKKNVIDMLKLKGCTHMNILIVK